VFADAYPLRRADDKIGIARRPTPEAASFFCDYFDLKVNYTRILGQRRYPDLFTGLFILPCQCFAI